MRIGIKLFKHNVLLHTILSICGTHCKCEKMIGWKHSSISTTNSMHAKELCRGGVEVVRSELHTHSSISCEHQLQNESERCVQRLPKQEVGFPLFVSRRKPCISCTWHSYFAEAKYPVKLLQETREWPVKDDWESKTVVKNIFIFENSNKAAYKN
jgi:hypothetical protein